jgi:hypothetical protein
MLMGMGRLGDERDGEVEVRRWPGGLEGDGLGIRHDMGHGATTGLWDHPLAGGWRCWEFQYMEERTFPLAGVDVEAEMLVVAVLERPHRLGTVAPCHPAWHLL